MPYVIDSTRMGTVLVKTEFILALYLRAFMEEPNMSRAVAQLTRGANCARPRRVLKFSGKSSTVSNILGREVRYRLLGLFN